jgi:hypothetical protein
MKGTLTAAPSSAAPSSAAPSSAARSCALRPVIVVASLADLRGPADGLVELPQRLFWSGAEHVFDLGDADRVLEMYEAVFDAARTEADLAEHLNGEILPRVWPGLALAPRVRLAWEEVHPELVALQLPRAELASAPLPAPAVIAA